MRHIWRLQSLAADYNMAIIITTQVYGVPEIKTVYEVAAKTGMSKMPYGGEVLAHSATYWLSLVRVSKRECRAYLFDAPDLPPAECRFAITEAGIADV